MADTLQTPLSPWHRAHGGRMVDFAGWSMPLQYASIVDEHVATRTAVGLFDISHMGRLEFAGPDAPRLLDRLVTRRVANLPAGAIRYALVTNDQGGILDDVLVYHVPRPDGSSRMLMVVNAANREKIVRWIEQKRDDDATSLIDLTQQTAMLAVQGPAAISLVDPLLDVSLAELKYYRGRTARLAGVEVVVSRTGYTGEDGCELWIPGGEALHVWEQLLEQGQGVGAKPVGLGARDTLRLEAAMPLYGHELSEQVHPYQAGLAFAVQLEDHDFCGRKALAAARDDRTTPVRVGMALTGRRVPRPHYDVHHQGTVVGTVTSGTFSPTLQRPIAMGYVSPDASRVGTSLHVDIRGHLVPAEVVDMPFYKRPT